MRSLQPQVLLVITPTKARGTSTWDAHTIVNGGLLAATGFATIVGAPVVLGGIAAYGVADYFFDIGDKIDSSIGRNSGVWEDSK